MLTDRNIYAICVIFLNLSVTSVTLEGGNGVKPSRTSGDLTLLPIGLSYCERMVGYCVCRRKGLTGRCP